jgi:DegV family protein with EDD domain
MTVRVVTDSSSDIPPELAREMGISVVPIYVMFGDETYRDRVDIFEEEFYQRLVHNSVYPSTSIPTPQDFAAVYDGLAGETSEILSIHISTKLSGTCGSAILGAQMYGGKCRIEVVDSLTVSVGLGMLVLAAAREARAGKSLQQVADIVRGGIPKVHSIILADTLKYVAKSGRISPTYGNLGAFLGIRALLGMKDGSVHLTSLARTRPRALERMYNFARSFRGVEEIGLGYTTGHEDAQALTERLAAITRPVPIYVSRVGPSIGTHCGPGCIWIGVREREKPS